VLVIDSFKAVHDLSQSTHEMRRLSYRMGAVLSAFDVTTFLVGEYEERDVATHPEFAVADGIVQLEREALDRADARYMRVRKLRGSAYSEGWHAFRITPAGLEVYPRLVTPEVAPTYLPQTERVSTGVKGLDALVEGGLLRGSATLVQGSAGSGKTTLALAFMLEGLRNGEPSLFLNLQENPTHLAQTVQALGVSPEECRDGDLIFRYESPVELRIDALVVEVARLIEEKGIRRVVIDALTELRWAASTLERFHDYVYALAQHFRTQGVTAILTMEAPARHQVNGGGWHSRVSTLCDGLIELTITDEAAPERCLRVVKMRGTEHPLGGRRFIISREGMKVVERDQE
jgi:circadian clock protein KaiC